MNTGDNADCTAVQRGPLVDRRPRRGSPDRVDPDSGERRSTRLRGPATPDAAYDGVRGGRDYYTPTRSDARTAPATRPAGAERGRRRSHHSVRDFPGLFAARAAPRLSRSGSTCPGTRPVRQPRRAHPGEPEPQRGARRDRDRLREGHRAAGAVAPAARRSARLRWSPRPERGASTRTVPQRPAPPPAVQARVHRPALRHLRHARPATASPRRTSRAAKATTRSAPSRGLRFVVLDSVAAAR